MASGSIGIWWSNPAITAFRRSIDIRIATLPAGDLGIARPQNNLARLLITLNRLQEAKPLVDAAKSRKPKCCSRSVAKPAAHALALGLKERFLAIPKTYPALTFSHPRVQAVIDKSAD